MGTKSNSTSAAEVRFNKMSDGLSTVVAEEVDTILLGNKSYTPKGLATTFANGADACSAVTTAVAQAKEARTARASTLAITDPLYEQAKTWVKLQFANQPSVLAACGITMKARSKPSAKTLADANVKRQKTIAGKKGPATPATGS